MFKFMNHHYHVYLLGSDKYPNNIKISHSSHMNLCKTFYAWGQYFFRQSFTCKKKKKKVYLKKKKAKSKSFSWLVNTRIMWTETISCWDGSQGLGNVNKSSPKVENVTGLQYKVLCPISKLY